MDSAYPDTESHNLEDLSASRAERTHNSNPDAQLDVGLQSSRYRGTAVDASYRDHRDGNGSGEDPTVASEYLTRDSEPVTGRETEYEYEYEYCPECRCAYPRGEHWSVHPHQPRDMYRGTHYPSNSHQGSDADYYISADSAPSYEAPSSGTWTGPYPASNPDFSPDPWAGALPGPPGPTGSGAGPRSEPPMNPVPSGNPGETGPNDTGTLDCSCCCCCDGGSGGGPDCELPCSDVPDCAGVCGILVVCCICG